jgi:hypothetical protein|tara:strand:- start:6496 stop:6768 length:273 start_codon:yes stop_codon:yes gene_type:complete
MALTSVALNSSPSWTAVTLNSSPSFTQVALNTSPSWTGVALNTSPSWTGFTLPTSVTFIVPGSWNDMTVNNWEDETRTWKQIGLLGKDSD